MKQLRTLLLGLVIPVFSMAQTTPEAKPTFIDENLEVVAETGKFQPIGVAVSKDNRVFVSFPRKAKDYQFGLTEIVAGKRVAYPDEKWNEDGPESSHFVSVQDLCVDDQNNLWVLDSKPAPKSSIFKSEDQEVEEGKFKLIKINIDKDKVDHIYTFFDLDKTISGLNDIRVDTKKNIAYLTDPGQSAIVILDLKSGKTKTVLKNHASTVADSTIVLTYHGEPMATKDGKPFSSNANGIALTKDHKYLYYKPINQRNLFRIETQYLADETLTDSALATHVEDMGRTSTSHGLIADETGNIYITSSTDYSIKYLTPEGDLMVLTRDSRLLWPDSFGIGSDGYLYFSCAQLHLQPTWNKGVSKVEAPYKIFRVKLPNQ